MDYTKYEVDKLKNENTCLIYKISVEYMFKENTLLCSSESFFLENCYIHRINCSRKHHECITMC